MEIPAATRLPIDATAGSSSKKKPFYTSLSFQVLVAIAIAIALGYSSPSRAMAMKPLGSALRISMRICSSVIEVPRITLSARAA